MKEYRCPSPGICYYICQLNSHRIFQSEYCVQHKTTEPLGLDVFARLNNSECEIKTSNAADNFFSWHDGVRKPNHRGGVSTQCLPELRKMRPLNAENRSRVSTPYNSPCPPLNREKLADNSAEDEYDLLDYFGSYDANFSRARQQLPVPEGLAVIERLSNKELETFQYADLVLTWQNGERKLEYMSGLMSQCLPELEEKRGPKQFYIGSRVTSAALAIAPVLQMWQTFLWKTTLNNGMGPCNKKEVKAVNKLLRYKEGKPHNRLYKLFFSFFLLFASFMTIIGRTKGLSKIFITMSVQ
ncbi:uncharacterized protein [Ptychodera flava]|uniref:uncharacterized protein n=1 Tax=Ptychodera flava TaxID=63121 RepID=UPI003969C30C